MKNSIKKIALLLAVLTCSSVLATAAAAKDIFVAAPNKADSDRELVETEPAINMDSETGHVINAAKSSTTTYNTPVYKTDGYRFRKHPVIKHDFVKNDYCDFICG